jgi:transcription initiation factor TFIIIB Brf1 subunit/transcription initiation factor TFIIB
MIEKCPKCGSKLIVPDIYDIGTFQCCACGIFFDEDGNEC